MIQKLIIVRHTEAEMTEMGLNDTERKLTVLGKSEAKRAAKNLKTLLSEEKEILLWSSPMVRAVATAKIINKKLNSKKIEMFSYIAEGDFDQLREAAEKSQATCVVIIGHEPTLGEWAKRIANCELSFKKGSAAAFTFPTDEFEMGNLLWFVQLNALHSSE